jgi:hypothetical protein
VGNLLMTIPNINELADRVKALSGPDREVDALIAVAVQYVGDFAVGAKNITADPDDKGWLLYDLAGEGCTDIAPSYTASLDVALSLIEPDEYWRLGNDGEGADPADFKATVTSHDEEANLHFHDAVASTPALALAAAALKAYARSAMQS